MPPSGLYNVFELSTTGGIIGISTTGGAIPVTQAIPPAADVVAGSISSTGTLIGIPANRTWFGSLALAMTAASTAGQVAIAPSVAINTLGATVTPAAGVILFCPVTLPSNVGNTTTATNPPPSGQNSVALANVLIAVGSSSATLTLSRTAANASMQLSANANGYLL